MSQGQELIDFYNKLPDKCKEMFFDEVSKVSFDVSFEEMGKICNSVFSEIFEFYEYCESPIEQIFLFAFSIYRSKKDLPCIIFPQEEVTCCDGKEYRADFILVFSESLSARGLEPINNVKLLIECDGHDFHEKTKDQVARDNDRDLDLKNEGYDIIHFSGSQIFNDPMGCVEKAVSCFKKKIGGIKREF